MLAEKRSSEVLCRRLKAAPVSFKDLSCRTFANSRLVRLDPRLCSGIVTTAPTHGDIAQLGERMTGSHEVRGSIPLISTMSGAGGGGSRRLFSRCV